MQLMVPGIDQWPDDSRNWDCRGQTWSNLNPLPVQNATVEDIVVTDRADYFCGPIGRAFHQQRRIDRVKAVLKPYVDGGFDIIADAHSNGTDIVLNALKQMGWPRVEALHLVSGACQADFEKNGLNNALCSRRIGKVYVYVAGKDWPLRIARSWLGHLLGYGTLGLRGPLNVSETVTHQVEVFVRPEFGHGTWFAPEYFEETMRLLRRT